MSLITKPPSWAFNTNNMTASAPTTTVGTDYTAGANNVDGAAVEVLPALTHDAEYLIIGFANTDVSAAGSDQLADILIDPAGGSSWSVLIEDLIAGYIAGSVPPGRIYHFPLWVPAGASIGVRGKKRNAVDIAGCRALIHAMGANANPSSWWCGQKVTSIGPGANSGGVAHTPGNNGVFSSWTNFGSVTPAAAGAIAFGFQPTNAGALTAIGYHWEFGAGSTRIGPTYFGVTSSAESLTCTDGGPIFQSIPAGTQLQARATCSGTAVAHNVAAYVVH